MIAKPQPDKPAYPLSELYIVQTGPYTGALPPVSVLQLKHSFWDPDAVGKDGYVTYPAAWDSTTNQLISPFMVKASQIAAPNMYPTQIPMDNPKNDPWIAALQEWDKGAGMPVPMRALFPNERIGPASTPGVFMVYRTDMEVPQSAGDFTADD